MEKQLNRTLYPAKYFPEKILQFGEGNFLRAFFDWMVHKMNERTGFDSGVVIVQPLKNATMTKFDEQDSLFTVRLTGLVAGQVSIDHEVVSCVNRGINAYTDFSEFMKLAEKADLQFVVSNTTEAGIVFNPDDKFDDTPPSSYPGKLTKFLFARFEHFGGTSDSGLIVLPCELIDRNGDALLLTIREFANLWNLPEAFLQWVHQHCQFCNTLVDRIVPGFPGDNAEDIFKELGYTDKLLVEAERFHLWVIEGPKEVARAFPAPDAGLNVVFTDDLERYRTRKVRVLNGAHTSMVPVGYLAGFRTVKECVDDPDMGMYVSGFINEEVLPSLDTGDTTVAEFATNVVARFKNPYIKHYLASIALNSISKYKTRVLPTVLEYYTSHHALPRRAVFALAALVRFYRGDLHGATIPLNDNQEAIEFIQSLWQDYSNDKIEPGYIAKTILRQTAFWDQDLSSLPGFTDLLTEYLSQLAVPDPKEAIVNFIRTNSNS